MQDPKTIRLLIIEDNENDAILMLRELRRQGFAPESLRVETAEQFVQALETGSWDAVISDFYLPQFSVADALAILHTRAVDLPFVVVSGSVGEEKAVEAMRAGAHDYIFKNSLARLGPAISRELHDASVRRERRTADQYIAELNRDLQRRLDEQRALFDLLPVGITIAEDPACRRVQANVAFAEIVGVPPGSNVSLTAPEHERPGYRALIDGREVPPTELPLQRAAATGQEVKGIEVELVRPDGAHVWALVSAVPLFDEQGRPRGAIATLSETTAMKHAEASLRNSEKLATVGRLAATIAHEINNPLESVTNVLYLLQRMPDMSARSREFVEVAQQEMQRISLIVKQTLGFHRESVAPVRVSVADILDNVLNLYTSKLDSLGIRVDKRYRSTGEISAFPGEIRQVFSNLIINAADAIGRNGRVWLRVRDVTGRGPRGTLRGVRITVADSGPGIPEELRRRVFEPFFTTKGEKGTGLGLWVTNGIIAKHGGRIHLRSSTRPRRSGTVFSIYLPAIAARAEAATDDGQPFVASRR